MMFWMAYGSASGGLVRQRVSLYAWVAIMPPTEFGARLFKHPLEPCSGSSKEAPFS